MGFSFYLLRILVQFPDKLEVFETAVKASSLLTPF